mmetsp:Transcript_85447/g.174319  ORF Transcript_85447/g.174319 Transcript_85447/m.174319 type:complete len:266 (+) Transcript_85447:1287-2084(+)
MVWQQLDASTTAGVDGFPNPPSLRLQFPCSQPELKVSRDQKRLGHQIKPAIGISLLHAADVPPEQIFPPQVPRGRKVIRLLEGTKFAESFRPRSATPQQRRNGSIEAFFQTSVIEAIQHCIVAVNAAGVTEENLRSPSTLAANDAIRVHLLLSDCRVVIEKKYWRITLKGRQEKFDGWPLSCDGPWHLAAVVELLLFPLFPHQQLQGTLTLDASQPATALATHLMRDPQVPLPALATLHLSWRPAESAAGPRLAPQVLSCAACGS